MSDELLRMMGFDIPVKYSRRLLKGRVAKIGFLRRLSRYFGQNFQMYHMEMYVNNLEIKVCDTAVVVFTRGILSRILKVVLIPQDGDPLLYQIMALLSIYSNFKIHDSNVYLVDKSKFHHVSFEETPEKYPVDLLQHRMTVALQFLCPASEVNEESGIVSLPIRVPRGGIATSVIGKSARPDLYKWPMTPADGEFSCLNES